MFFWASQGVFFTEVQEGLIVRREVSPLPLLKGLRKVQSALLGYIGNMFTFASLSNYPIGDCLRQLRIKGILTSNDAK